MFLQHNFCADRLVNRSIVIVQNQITDAPLLRGMSAHNIAEALQDCFVEFSIYSVLLQRINDEQVHQCQKRMHSTWS